MSFSVSAAEIQKSGGGTIAWSDGSPFDGYMLWGLGLPTGYVGAAQANKYPNQSIPRSIKIQVRGGIIDSLTRVPYTASIEPPGTRWFVRWYDQFNTLISDQSATALNVNASPFSVTVPTLTAPTTTTTAPTPDADPAIPASPSSDYVLGGATLTTVGAIPFISGTRTINQDATNLFWDDGNNRLGIGTATPTKPLQVIGEVAATNLSASALTQNSILFAGTAGILAQNTSNLTWNNSTNVFRVVGTTEITSDVAIGGNVFIGGSSVSVGSTTLTTGTEVANPTSVDMDSSFGDDPPGNNFKLRLFRSSTGGAATYGLGVSDALFEIVSPADFAFFKNASTPVELLRLTSAGKVGIGTDTPQNFLDVRDSVKFSHGLSSTIIGLGDGSTAAGAGGVYVARANSGLTADGTLLHLGGFGGLQIHTADTPNSPGSAKVYVSSAGKVGIGKAIPLTSLGIASLPTFADNAAAVTGGLTTDDCYKTAAGALMIVV